MTLRSVVALCLVLAVILTACTSSEQASSSGNGETVDVVGASTQQDGGSDELR